MAGSRALKNRIKSTKNIRQMTRAMEAVSAVKMRRSVALAVSARPYALAALHLFSEVRHALHDDTTTLSPLLTQRPLRNALAIIIASDKGLAGSFNTSVFRTADARIASLDVPVRVVAVGKKVRDYYDRRNMLDRAYIGAGDFGAIDETRPIAEYVTEEFVSGRVDQVVIIYTNFISALRQTVSYRSLLPFSEQSLRQCIDDILPERGKYSNTPALLNLPLQQPPDILIEPSPHVVLSKLLPALVALEIHHAILEANASEHSSRMIAMKNASENADELAGDLTILYNKARQAQITKELAEISAGTEALHT
jgi:F-type H+-transporting ATPase subunit gamma